nr:VWA domain-containing protein [Simiduia agarivorans]
MVFWLLPLPLIWLLARSSSQQQAAIVIPSDWYTQPVSQADKHATRLLPWLFSLLLWALLLTAAAVPRWQGEAIELPASGRDLMLAVDISGSMETPDMVFNDQQANRLQVVKAVVSDFVERRAGDRLGLILFGTHAYLQAPLTFDRATVGQLLREAQLGFAGEKTAIGDAIGLAIKRLRERPAESRVLILLTDGANTAGAITPAQAATLAQQAGLKIYTIGLGAEQIIQPGLFGSQFGSRVINPSQDLDEKSLQDIAEKTGGRYFRARNPQELDTIYTLLDTLEPNEHDKEVFRPTRTLTHWPIGLALCLMILKLLGQWFTQWREAQV